jgi:hypothetical protein
MAKAWGCLACRTSGAATVTDADRLRNQIERAERFAASMTSETEQNRFEAIASDLRRELQLVEMRESAREV